MFSSDAPVTTQTLVDVRKPFGPPAVDTDLVQRFAGKSP